MNISHMEKIDTREPELSHRCGTERVLKEKVHRFCRVDFVDMHRLDSNSIDNFFWGIIVLYTRIPFGYTLLDIQKIDTYNKLSLLLPEDDRPFRSNDQSCSKEGESGGTGRFESRSINSFEATNDNQAHLSLGERNVSRGR